MNNLKYPLRISLLPFFYKIMMEQKINEETIENNLVFCIDTRKAFAIKPIPISVFEIRHIKRKYLYFLFRLNFDFCFFIKL